MSWKLENQEAFVVAEISLDEVKDCYNLRLVVEPLTVVRQGHEGDLEIIWPEKKTIEERRNEALILRCEDKFYFSRWEEHPEYHEMVIVRDLETGYEVKRFDGQLQRMPNGEVWVL